MGLVGLEESVSRINNTHLLLNIHLKIRNMVRRCLEKKILTANTVNLSPYLAEFSAGEVNNCPHNYQLIICMCICMLK